jgi:hypothetical protein
LFCHPSFYAHSRVARLIRSNGDQFVAVNRLISKRSVKYINIDQLKAWCTKHDCKAPYILFDIATGLDDEPRDTAYQLSRWHTVERSKKLMYTYNIT